MNPDCEAQRTTGDGTEELPEGWEDVDVLLEVSKRLDELAAALRPESPPSSLGVLEEPLVDMFERLATIVRIERLRHRPQRQFFRRAVENAYPIRDPKKERVPEGTKWCGSLYLTPKGELILTDGSPSEEGDHHCDEMGCSSVSHVIARIFPTVSRASGKSEEQECGVHTTEEPEGREETHG